MACYQRSLPLPPNLYPAAECACDLTPPAGKVLINPNTTLDDMLVYINALGNIQVSGAPCWGVISGSTIYIAATDYGAQGMPLDLIDAVNDEFFDSP